MQNKKQYSSWIGVKRLAQELGYDTYDVCNILWKFKYRKQPALLNILICAMIKKNLLRIQLGKKLRDEKGNITFQNPGETNIHYAIRADFNFFKTNYKIKKIWNEKPDFYKSLRQKYHNLYKRYSREINNHAKIIL